MWLNLEKCFEKECYKMTNYGPSTLMTLIC